MGMHDAQLPIPGEAIADRNSVEMIRAWVANKNLHISLNIGMWGKGDSQYEAEAWGILLADVTRHVANALCPSAGHARQRTIDAVRDSYLAELDHPTSPVAGNFTDEPSRN